jgi:hypothetical protein
MECCHECVVMAFPIVDIVRLISAQVSKSWLIAPGAALVWHAVDDWCPPKDLAEPSICRELPFLEQPVWLPATETYQSTSISPISRLVAKRIPSKYPMIRQSHAAFSPHCDAMWRRGLSNSADPLVFLLLVVSNSYEHAITRHRGCLLQVATQAVREHYDPGQDPIRSSRRPRSRDRLSMFHQMMTCRTSEVLLTEPSSNCLTSWLGLCDE